ncbi:MAG: RDD family protein, partial [Gammaproteobacteria bacterium]|nr:RDD family protein [Gammaproteobacteria bacterium]
MTNGRAVGRHFAYLASSLPLGLGFVWIVFDSKKRGWHDIICR